MKAIDVGFSDEDTLDICKHSCKSSVEPRRTRRKIETPVLYSDVMAQEREMERFTYEKTRYQPSASLPLTPWRKVERLESPQTLSKHQRAKERRSKRQKLRHNMSPQSLAGGLQRPLRGGVSRVELDELGTQMPLSHHQGVLQDTTLHSTAWRNLKFAKAPGNLLPHTDGISEPFARAFDAPLEAFSDELKEKCALSFAFVTSKPLTMETGTRGAALDKGQVDERIKQLMEDVTPLVKQCHAARANAILATTRQQIAVYIAQRSGRRDNACVLVAMPLQIPRLERVAKQRLCRNAERIMEGDAQPTYLVGKTTTGYAGHVYADAVTYLCKLAPMPRSTTCILSRGTHRVEDDPILRYVPHACPDTVNTKRHQVFCMGSSKGALVGMDDEVNEYVLRYVVRVCRGEQAVFEALQRCGAFTQPYASYFDLLARATRAKRCKNLVDNLTVPPDVNERPGPSVKTNVATQVRLQPAPSPILSTRLWKSDGLGIRHAPSAQYGDLAVKYQDLFCRRCCAYNCRNHGCNQPLPVVRVDPKYPLVKAAVNLWRRLEEKQMANEDVHEDLSDDMDDDQTLDFDGPRLERTGNTDKEDYSRRLALGEESNRRSVRTHTAARTKASSKLRAMRLKKLVRSETSDVSEYLGFDGVYQSLINDRKMKLLSADMRCGPHCSKRVSAPTHGRETKGSRDMRDIAWKDSEVALLTQLKQSVGLNPCALAAVLATQSCADVAAFLWVRAGTTEAGLEERCVLRRRRNRERSTGVLGNSFEHLRRTRSQRMKDRGANHEYVPCHHDGGSCDSAQCSCMRRDHYCEKSCGCSPDCSNRFPGCHCEVGHCRTSACPCYYAARECDPDVCVSCGACELPVIVANDDSKGKAIAQLKTCGNVNLTWGHMSKIGVSVSKTHGWGAFSLANVKTGDFLYEYTGSLLSQDEAERRGNVYDKTTISFLFDLTEDSVVDATRKGNKSKFANHDSNAPKCFARIMLVNGDHRIGIYAKQDITAGDELFFDYGYSGVIPDWSQTRIGSSKATASVAQDDDNSSSLVGVHF